MYIYIYMYVYICILYVCSVYVCILYMCVHTTLKSFGIVSQRRAEAVEAGSCFSRRCMHPGMFFQYGFACMCTVYVFKIGPRMMGVGNPKALLSGLQSWVSDPCY